MDRGKYYDQPHDTYGAHGGSDDSENYANSNDFVDEDPDLDSEAINDFTSQELDKRIQQMKAKIQDLQEDEIDFPRSSEKSKPISNKKDYKVKDNDRDRYQSPKDFGRNKAKQRDFDEDSMENYDNHDNYDEKERLKDKIEDIKKAIQQYNSDNDDEKAEESKIGKYYEEDEEEYQYQSKPKKPKYSKRSPPRKQWKDTDQEDNVMQGMLRC